MKECRAATRWAVCALVISMISMGYATWYLPGLIDTLNRLSELIEENNAGTLKRN